jgi:hypothetical protein
VEYQVNKAKNVSEVQAGRVRIFTLTFAPVTPMDIIEMYGMRIRSTLNSNNSMTFVRERTISTAVNRRS